MTRRILLAAAFFISVLWLVSWEVGPKYDFVTAILVRVVGYFDLHAGAITGLGTILLAVFTWRLWVSTDRLWEETKRAVGIERPWIFLEGVTIHRREQMGEPLAPNNFFIKLKWKNIGRTPALIESCKYQFIPTANLPITPIYAGSGDMGTKYSVSVGESFETLELGPGTAISDPLTLFGVLTYKELGGSMHQTGYALEISPHIAAFNPYDSDNYNFYT